MKTNCFLRDRKRKSSREALCSRFFFFMFKVVKHLNPRSVRISLSTCHMLGSLVLSCPANKAKPKTLPRRGRSRPQDTPGLAGFRPWRNSDTVSPFDPKAKPRNCPEPAHTAGLARPAPFRPLRSRARAADRIRPSRQAQSGLRAGAGLRQRSPRPREPPTALLSPGRGLRTTCLSPAGFRRVPGAPPSPTAPRALCVCTRVRVRVCKCVCACACVRVCARIPQTCDSHRTPTGPGEPGVR